MNLARSNLASMKFIRSNIKAFPKANIFQIGGRTMMSSFSKTLVKMKKYKLN
jgi:hypothetical protein